MAKLTEQQIEELAYEIKGLLVEHELWYDVVIYFNGVAMSDDRENLYAANPKDYFKYAGDILSMSFEGGLYEIINYECPYAKYCDDFIEKFNEILRKYGVYFEQGNAWNLSLYYEDEEEV